MYSNIQKTKKRFIVYACVCVIAFSAFGGCGARDKALTLSLPEASQESDTQTPVVQNAEEDSVIFVHVCGAVANPGVVELPAGSRAEAALLAAGGLQENGDSSYVNLASRVVDGQQLYFPTIEEASAIKEAQSAEARGLVNINTAGEEELCTLPGIGTARAQAIIAYREAHGGFQTKEDIMQVSGIKQSAYDKLCDSITVE